MGKEEEKKVLVDLELYVSELMYDIENYAFIEGDIMKPQDEHDRHMVMDIGQAGNIDRVKRVLDIAYAECVEFLFPFTKEQADDEAILTNVKDDPSAAYRIKMRLPWTISKTTIDFLKKLLHEYMVCRVLSDWFGITNINVRNMWLERMEDAKQAIRRILTHRRTQVRLKQNPF